MPQNGAALWILVEKKTLSSLGREILVSILKHNALTTLDSANPGNWAGVVELSLLSQRIQQQ
jgi:hypothetical protein